MSRILIAISACALASSVTPLMAADWGTSAPGFRPAYPMDMAPMEDSLDFEFGLRYFYGMGGQSFTNGSTYSATDLSHSLEVHGRIDDHSTSSFLKGHIGYGAITDGEFSMDDTTNGSYSTGRVGYVNADFGYLPINTGGVKAGAFIGYMYSDESPQNTGPITHGLRLGVAARAEFGDMFDITAEGAIIPYSAVSGSMANPAGTLTGIEGSLYGAAGEVMVGAHLTDNFVIRAGARATYLNGHVQADQPGEHYIEMFRWGPLVELTATF